MPTVSNDWALAYTGGKAGKANATLPPVVIGYVNEEGGVPAFPEATQGLNAAVKYVNDELGGIQGHPIQIEKCFVVANEDGQKCGTQLANDDKVKLVITGALTVGNQAPLQHRLGQEAGPDQQPGGDPGLPHGVRTPTRREGPAWSRGWPCSSPST